MIGTMFQKCSLGLALTITLQESCGARPHFTDASVEGQRSEARLASEKNKTSSEGDLWGCFFYLGVKRWGMRRARGPTPIPVVLWED